MEALKAQAVQHQLDIDAINEIAKTAIQAVDEGIKSGPKLAGHALDDAYMQMFRVFAIGRNIAGVCAAFLENYEQIMTDKYQGELVADKAAGVAKSLVRACKKVGSTKIYNTRPTIELEIRGGKIIHSLLDTLWIGINRQSREEDDGKRCFSLISQSYRNVYEFELAEAAKCDHYGYSRQQMERYYDLLLLTDYVSGMTDTFACNLYRSLNHG